MAPTTEPTALDVPEVTFGGTLSLGELLPASYNPRRMAPAEMERLIRSIEEFGFVEPVVVRPEDRLIVGGHQRTEAYRLLLTRRGLTPQEIDRLPVPVAFLPEGVSDSRIKILNLALNKIQGEWDYGRLKDVLADLKADVDIPTLELSGFDLPTVTDVLAWTGAAQAALSGGGGGGGGPANPDDEHHADDAPLPGEGPKTASAALDAARCRMIFEFATPEDADEARTILHSFGMTGDNASAPIALLEALRAALPLGGATSSSFVENADGSETKKTKKKKT